jgi:hypothetical protein
MSFYSSYSNLFILQDPILQDRIWSSSIHTVLKFGRYGWWHRKPSLAQQNVQEPARMPVNRPVSQETAVNGIAPVGCQDRTLLMERLRSVDEDYELEEVDDTGHCQFDAIAKQVSLIYFPLIAPMIPTPPTLTLA